VFSVFDNHNRNRRETAGDDDDANGESERLRAGESRRRDARDAHVE